MFLYILCTFSLFINLSMVLMCTLTLDSQDFLSNQHIWGRGQKTTEWWASDAVYVDCSHWKDPVRLTWKTERYLYSSLGVDLM
jgi:hypothetical protein